MTGLILRDRATGRWVAILSDAMHDRSPVEVWRSALGTTADSARGALLEESKRRGLTMTEDRPGVYTIGPVPNMRGRVFDRGDIMDDKRRDEVWRQFFCAAFSGLAGRGISAWAEDVTEASEGADVALAAYEARISAPTKADG